MQRLLSLKLASNLSIKISDLSSSSSSSTLLSHEYKTFSTLSHTTTPPLHSLTSPISHQPPPHSLFSNFTTSLNSWLSHTTFSKRVHGFLSNPVTLKQFLSNTHLKVPSKSFVDGRIWFLRTQFPRKSFEFNNREFNSFRRSWRSWFQRLSTSDVVLGLIVANAAVFIFWRIANQNFMMKNFTISLDNIKSGRVHTMITSAFSHIDMEHIVSNMIGLYFFGMNIGRAFGPEFLLKLYLAGAIGGSVFYLLHHAFMAQTSKGGGFSMMDPSKIPGLGASGAVNAIMLLEIFLFPKSTLCLEFIIPVPAILLGIFLIGTDMLRIIEGDHRVSGSAHLGGAVVAALFWARIRKGIF